MTDLAQTIADYVRRKAYTKHKRGWWIVNIAEIERVFDLPMSTIITALRKAEDRELVHLFYGLDDEPHSCRPGRLH